MSIMKSSIAMMVILTACTNGPGVGVQPLRISAMPVPPPASAPGDASQSLSGSGSATSPATAQAPAVPQPPSAAEVAFMKARFSAIQPRSIAEDREYCGYLGRLPNGDFAISGPKRGAPAGCTPDNPPADLRVIASYHTHAAYAPRYDSEVPSATDLEGDFAEGINGYVATPGGRLWFNDRGSRSTAQLCGVGCLPSDPRFQPERAHPVQQSYSLAGLRQRQN